MTSRIPVVVARGRGLGRGTGAAYSLEPFRAWLLAYQAALGMPTRAALARALGMDESEVLRILRRKHASVSLDVVDRALLAAERSVSVDGRLVLGLDDLYALDGSPITLPDDAKVGAEHPESPRCASPGCGLEADGRFCSEHTERLARIRAAMDEDVARFRSRIGRKGARPSCCNPRCDNPRLPPARFCAECAQDGWDEERYE